MKPTKPIKPTAHKNNRRKFLKDSAKVFGTLTIIPSHVLFSQPELRSKTGELIRRATVAPSDKVNLACCGIGNRGRGVLNSFVKTGQANIVALCDVDMGGAHTLDSMNKFPDAPKFQDFRVMFDKVGKEFDAIYVATPDFSHFPITILAMSMGKHVYVEKPLTRTFQEAELLMEAAKKYDVVTQMGNQGHCQDNYYQFKAWVEAGIIEGVKDITVHMNGKASLAWLGYKHG